MPLDPGAFTSIFEGNRIHIEGQGSGPVVVAPTTGPGDDPEPSEEQIAFMAAQLVKHREVIEHAGWNPVPWIRRFRPQSQHDAIELMAVAQSLMDPGFTDKDLRSIASMILRQKELVKYFMVL